MDELICTRCGQANVAGANFCSECGAPIDTVQDHPTITFSIEGPPGEDEVVLDLDDVPAGGMFVVRTGGNAGSKFALDAEVTTVGRHPDSDIFLDDITVSRRHVEVIRRVEGYVVRDVGSLNGTYVNGDRIDEAPINAGDEVQVGKFKLAYVASPDSADNR